VNPLENFTLDEALMALVNLENLAK